MTMIPIVRPAFVAMFSLLAAACQTASLQDVAPTSVQVSRLDAGTTGTDAPIDGIAPGSAQTSNSGATASTEVRRNPGFASLIPIEQTPPAETKAFVASGASRSGEYPTFGQLPNTANAQFSDADKIAAEAEMTELLRSRASTPDARAQYDARLRQLRSLAANHGNDMQQQIEK
ncbi:hypothetical protein WNZ14_13270 [Hoeflea sp. AS60]|uniref:hypothetical protein n=1 Tax=Hoeflea sp. AS60 TaxID=3135780 RepID=UPI003177CB77